MSELKATSSGEIRARDALLGYWWYEKSEADKVIANSNYKRCLAMAKWCESERCKYPDAYGLISYKGLWLEKWHNRWLELAEKFKDNKEAGK